MHRQKVTAGAKISASDRKLLMVQLDTLGWELPSVEDLPRKSQKMLTNGEVPPEYAEQLTEAQEVVCFRSSVYLNETHICLSGRCLVG